MGRKSVFQQINCQKMAKNLNIFQLLLKFLLLFGNFTNGFGAENNEKLDFSAKNQISEQCLKHIQMWRNSEFSEGK